MATAMRCDPRTGEGVAEAENWIADRAGGVPLPLQLAESFALAQQELNLPTMPWKNISCVLS